MLGKLSHTAWKYQLFCSKIVLLQGGEAKYVPYKEQPLDTQVTKMVAWLQPKPFQDSNWSSSDKLKWGKVKQKCLDWAIFVSR